MTYTNLIIGLLIVGVLVSITNLIFFELPQERDLGFQNGYVCAYYHEQEKQDAFTIVPEKSEYCKKFSDLWDEEITKIKGRIA